MVGRPWLDPARRKVVEQLDDGENVVIEHLQSHTLGLVHLIGALSAMLFGTAVIFGRGVPTNIRED